MANTRRKFIPKPPILVPCETCIELKYTPTYVEALQFVRNFPSVQAGTDWYHLNDHSIFVK